MFPPLLYEKEYYVFEFSLFFFFGYIFIYNEECFILSFCFKKKKSYHLNLANKMVKYIHLIWGKQLLYLFLRNFFLVMDFEVMFYFFFDERKGGGGGGRG